MSTLFAGSVCAMVSASEWINVFSFLMYFYWRLSLTDVGKFWFPCIFTPSKVYLLVCGLC